MTDEQLTPEQQEKRNQKVPPYRTFTVTRTRGNEHPTWVETVHAHGIEELPAGGALRFGEIMWDPYLKDWRTWYTRHIAAGTWTDVQEVFAPRSNMGAVN